MSIKTSAEEWVRKGPTQAIAVIAAAGLVVGAVIGLGAGYEIEKSRTKSDVSRLREQIKKAGGATNATGPLGQRVGKVTADSGGSITLDTKQRGVQVLITGSSTVYETVVAATIGKVQVGNRVLVTPGGREIIVLPSASEMGRKVSKVSADSIQIAKANGAPAGTLKTKDVKVVETTASGSSSDVKNGVSVLAGGRAQTEKNFNATEVIVLPSGSGFAS